MDENTIDTAFQQYKTTREALFDASQDLGDAQVALAKKKIDVYNQGLIDGSNETIRRGQYDTYTREEAEIVIQKEKVLDTAQMNHDLAYYEVSRCKLLVAFLGLNM